MQRRTIQVMAIVVAMALALGISIMAQAPAGGGQGRGGGGAAPGAGGGGRGAGGGAGGAQARGGGGPGLTLTSTAWQDGGEIPAKNAGGQAGQAISPALTWTNVPMGTVEFVLIMNDPEPVTPRGSATGDILHWLVAKIPANATSLPEAAGNANGQLPAGAKQIQTYRGPGAGDAGPPHHYTLTLYALSAPLELADSADRAAVLAAMEGKVLARAIFNGRFKQP
jgi:Raf kinase inhibitor-like YbhB/YbcL family protein